MLTLKFFVIKEHLLFNIQNKVDCNFIDFKLLLSPYFKIHIYFFPIQIQYLTSTSIATSRRNVSTPNRSMMVHDASTSLTIAPSTQTKQITDWNQAGTGFRERLAMYSWKATRGSLNLVLLLQTSVVPSTRELLWVVIHMKVKVLWR